MQNAKDVEKHLNQNKMKKYKNNYGEEEDTSLGALFGFFLIMITPVLVAIFINI